MEIIIHQAILHVLDTTMDAPVLSGGGMEMTAEKTAYFQYHIEKLLRYLPAPEAARMSGGGSKSREWAQMFSDVLQMPMEIPAASELGTLGAAMCAGIGAGLFRGAEDAVAGMVRIARTVSPSPDKKHIYDMKYDRWTRAIASLDAFW